MLRPSLLRPFRNCRFLREAMEAAEDRRWGLERNGKDRGGRVKKEIQKKKDGWLPLYDTGSRQPYEAVAACGPWVVTRGGGVVYDAGGYGMLAFGHPSKQSPLSEALSSQNLPQANWMTPHKSQVDFDSEVKKHIGPRKFTCLNSGSEAVSLALRIANAHPHPHPTVIALKGSFHGRTEGPARVSDSTRAFYARTLSDHGRREEGGESGGEIKAKEEKPRVRFVEPNDWKGLEEEFSEARREGQHVEAVIMEPVMGEGRPALQIGARFFEAASSLVREGGGMMIVDSVQAGGRAHGVLSVTDYPGFETLDAPDVEVFAKALNGGQFPASLVAVGKRAEARFEAGMYGNTMAANPRGLAVMRACMEALPGVRENVKERGMQLVEELEKVKRKRASVLEVRGCGLLVGMRMGGEEEAKKAELRLRRSGLNCVRGGGGWIRMTPWFSMSEEEVELVARVVRKEIGR